ncbi:hypothetical protein D5S18_00300 [Nocardia panacis]|uniref:Uncharacterized protein n=1 Tax=Nocardia panacis TaxID=2340916 RepID=A0A3A4KQY7_9NOCA|nr:hypothetical protein [Nocardia panacis]RJO80230.1 hypothetical protein D5S18_00300 [Nocardia panacis]
MSAPLLPQFVAPPLPAQHRNRELRAVVETLPGYLEAEAVAQQANRQRAQLEPARPHLADTDEQIIAAGVIPDDYAARVRDTATATIAHDAAVAALHDLHKRATEKCAALITGAVDDILAALHTRLQRVVADATKAVGTLDGVTDVEIAVRIGGDTAKAWAALANGWDTHQRLRAAQNAVMASYDRDAINSARPAWSADPIASDLYLSNLDQVWPTWRTPISVDTGFGAAEGDTAPWPEPGPALLLWAITHGAQLWIPTRPRLQRLWADRATGRSETPAAERDHRRPIQPTTPPRFDPFGARVR